MSRSITMGHIGCFRRRTQARIRPPFRWKMPCLRAVLLFAVSWWIAMPLMAQEWLPVRDVELEVAAGGLLDLSHLVAEGPAGRYGWAVPLEDGRIGFEKLRKPQRFFAASFAFSPPSGGFPSKDEADRLVAQLRRTGYNAVRFQNVDANLMTNRVEDFDFDPVQLDRFDYFFSRLKAGGLYVVMDVMYLGNGGYGNIFPHRWVMRYNLTQDVYVEDSARAHWLRLLKAMLGRPNKYSGTVPLQDPALLALILVNEGAIVELAYRQSRSFDSPFPAVYAKPFTDWLRRKYQTDQLLAEAWRGELAAGESLEAVVAVPKSLKSQGARHADFMQFVVDKERETYRWMHDQARAMGFAGFTTAFNDWSDWQSDIARASLSLVDMHAYHSPPSSFASPGSKVAQTSSLPDAALYVRKIAAARQWGKPFTVTEYGQPFWNAWRHESAVLAPSYAALQGWDLITQFAETPVQLRYDKTAPPRRAAIHPFGVSADPVLRAGERLAALLYQRGDVERSPARISVMLDPQSVLRGGEGMSYMGEALNRLSLLAGFGLQVGEPAVRHEGNAYSVASGAGTARWKGAITDLATRAGIGIGDASRIDELKSAGLLPKANKTSFAGQVYESDTGQLTLQARERRFIVNTPRTVAVATPDAPVVAGGLSVDATSVPVTVALSAMDGEPLSGSRRMLLLVLTDAQNSNMAFRDADRTTLERLGGLPVQMQGVRLAISWKGLRPQKLKAYALALNGERREPVDLVSRADGWSMTIDTAKLAGGPTTHFELSEE